MLYPLFPPHDPVVGYFLGKMMKPDPNAPPPEVMMGGTINGEEFTLSTLWNEEGLEMEGGFSEKEDVKDFLSDMIPKVFLDPTGGFWGAAREMQVRSVMQVSESLGKDKLFGTHTEAVLSEDEQTQTSNVETSLQGSGFKVHHTMTLVRDKRILPMSDAYMLVPKQGEVTLEFEATRGENISVKTPTPLCISFEKNGGWKMKGEIITKKEVLDANGQLQQKETREPVESLYNLLKMPFLGVPYIQVDSKVGHNEAHYFIAPLPALIKLSKIISDFLSQKSGKPIFIPPYKALEFAQKIQPLSNLSLAKSPPLSLVKPFYEVVQKEGAA